MYNTHYLEDVVAHYDRICNASRDPRRCEIFRQLSNQIKVICISNVMNQVRRLPVILDVGCGRGQDLLKYKHFRVKRYIGVDASKHNISECIERHHNMLARSQQNSECLFIHGNFLDMELDVICDVVSLQMSVQYFLQSEESLDQLIKKIDNIIAKNGYVLMTFPDGAAVKYDIDNDINNTHFDFIVPEDTRTALDTGMSPYGLLIKTKLDEFLDHVPEFLVNKSNLIDKFKGYRIVLSENGQKILHDNVKSIQLQNGCFVKEVDWASIRYIHCMILQRET